MEKFYASVYVALPVRTSLCGASGWGSLPSTGITGVPWPADPHCRCRLAWGPPVYCNATGPSATLQAQPDRDRSTVAAKALARPGSTSLPIGALEGLPCCRARPLRASRRRCPGGNRLSFFHRFQSHPILSLRDVGFSPRQPAAFPVPSSGRLPRKAPFDACKYSLALRTARLRPRRTGLPASATDVSFRP